MPTVIQRWVRSPLFRTAVLYFQRNRWLRFFSCPPEKVGKRVSWWTAGCRLPTADCQPPTADCRLPTVPQRWLRSPILKTAILYFQRNRWLRSFNGHSARGGKQVVQESVDSRLPTLLQRWVRSPIFKTALLYFQRNRWLRFFSGHSAKGGKQVVQESVDSRLPTADCRLPAAGCRLPSVLQRWLRSPIFRTALLCFQRNRWLRFFRGHPAKGGKQVVQGSSDCRLLTASRLPLTAFLLHRWVRCVLLHATLPYFPRICGFVSRLFRHSAVPQPTPARPYPFD